MIRRTATMVALLALVMGTTGFGPAPAAAQDAGYRVVFQVSDGDPTRWDLTLNNAKNVQAELGKDRVIAEIVAYGPGIDMLKLDSPVGGRISEALQAGVRVVVCENTMTAQKLSRDDMLPAIGYVHAGVVQLMQRQREGYAYIRP